MQTEKVSIKSYLNDQAKLVDLAEQVVDKRIFPSETKDKRGKRPPKLTSHQLRRFYGELKRIESALRQREDPESEFINYLPRIKLVIPKVKYAQKRKGAPLPEAFGDWLCECLEEVDDWETFKAFMLHFEAVVGFCYGTGKLSDN